LVASVARLGTFCSSPAHIPAPVPSFHVRLQKPAQSASSLSVRLSYTLAHLALTSEIIGLWSNDIMTRPSVSLVFLCQRPLTAAPLNEICETQVYDRQPYEKFTASSTAWLLKSLAFQDVEKSGVLRPRTS
jgi:hypothetical protein